MSKHKKTDAESDMTMFLTENGIDNKTLLSEIIEVLQQFCQDNVLALTPLLQEGTEENVAVQERICYFSVISRLLGSIDTLSQADVVFTLNDKATKKKNFSKKKHKMKKRD